MPGAASCQPAALALPPARFRAPGEPNAPNTAIPDAPVPLGLPPPRVAFKSPRKAPDASRASSDAGSSSSHAQHRASDTAPATNSCQVPASASQQQQKALSLMELVNAAARKEERQEALVRAGKRTTRCDDLSSWPTYIATATFALILSLSHSHHPSFRSRATTSGYPYVCRYLCFPKDLQQQ
jgi:hypothetical protein